MAHIKRKENMSPSMKDIQQEKRKFVKRKQINEQIGK
jgi:ABC-type tungstate transport system permease subunit